MIVCTPFMEHFPPDSIHCLCTQGSCAQECWTAVCWTTATNQYIFGVSVFHLLQRTLFRLVRQNLMTSTFKLKQPQAQRVKKKFDQNRMVRNVGISSTYGKFSHNQPRKMLEQWLQICYHNEITLHLSFKRTQYITKARAHNTKHSSIFFMCFNHIFITIGWLE